MQVSEECVQMYRYIQRGQRYRWITFKLNDDQTSIVVDCVGDTHSSFSSFMDSLPSQETRWCLFDIQFRSLDTTRSKLMFITWVPSTIRRDTLKETARVKFNGVFWSSTLKKEMPAVVCSYQASDASDLAWDNLLSKACRYEKDPVDLEWRPEQDNGQSHEVTAY
eukprot:TRINITY_DN3408_c0_g1_i5.p1 TRINITY_DN3408_c0_g1~~TRINITY_DN3408_c0_g1_i5.p1  ORF type:complete len:165 (-),score=21.52 TRINITY_DN3408_c0_g1_i5:86-580(-)